VFITKYQREYILISYLGIHKKSNCMKICLTAFLLFYTSFGFAQKDNPDNLRAKIFELTVKTVPPDSLKLPFETIKIIDSRFDTSKLGFRISRGFLIFEKILLKPDIETGIEKFFNEYYQHNFTPNGNVLLISIKKLWINNMPNRQGEQERNVLSNLSHQDIYAKFEYYFGSVNAYVPLKRIDTIFQITPDKKVEDYDPKDENKLPFLCFALEKMAENFNYGQYIKDFEKKKKMSVEDIEKYNATIKNIPILNEPTKKGVFLTFNEFKNNLPSVISFSKRKIPKKKIYEIIDEKDNVIFDYFAYYDGEKLAIAKNLSSLFDTRRLNNPFRRNISQDNYGMYKINGSFQFFENYFQYKAPTNSNIPTYILVRVPRQIDLETGEIY
jgi:hypothetical protein